MILCLHLYGVMVSMLASHPRGAGYNPPLTQTKVLDVSRKADHFAVSKKARQPCNVALIKQIL